MISRDKAKRSVCAFQIYKPVRMLRPAQVLELGCIISEMSERELQVVDLSNMGVVAHLGSFKLWNRRKVSFPPRTHSSPKLPNLLLTEPVSGEGGEVFKVKMQIFIDQNCVYVSLFFLH